MILRKAKVSSIDHLTGAGILEFLDNRGLRKPNVIMTQPYVGRGWGIRAGIETESTVLVEDDAAGESHVLGYLSDRKFFKNVPIEQDAATKAQPTFKELQEGEIAIQSLQNSLVFLNKFGDISLSTADGTSFELNRTTDSINQISVSNKVLSEAAIITSGPTRRDTRTKQQKIDDIFLDSLIGYDFSQLETTDIIGADPKHIVRTETDKVTGTFDPEEGSPSILNVPGISNLPFKEKIVTDIKNPAITEYDITVNEFSDGIASLNISEHSDSALRSGFLPINLAGKFAIGTVTDEVGRISRFDYTFSSPKGHGEIWKIPGINDKQVSTDFKRDPNRSITTVESLGDQFHWTVSDITRFNTALAFQLILNTRGADNQGQIPGINPGSPWSFQVDKEGLTKWNIPASTSLNNQEQFREGRSLLWNMDGSLTMSLGKETNQDLESITGKTNQTSFVNGLNSRLNRSWTADFEGSTEWKMGADDIGQSQMIEADGALSFYYGKYIANDESVVANTAIGGLTSPSKSGSKIGTSISGRTEGSIELDVGTNTAQSLQSIALNTSGVVAITLGEDRVKDSLKLDAAGSMKFKTVNGGHRIELLSNQAQGSFKDGIRIQHGGLNQSLFQIDENGVITLRNSLANSNIIMSQQGDINIINATGTKISLSTDGTISLGSGLAGIDISPTNGVILRTPGGSISLNQAGKVEVAANLGFTVTGSQSHLNTTSVLFGPSAATSPYRVAVSGGGLGTDPLTGHSNEGFSLLGAIG